MLVALGFLLSFAPALAVDSTIPASAVKFDSAVVALAEMQPEKKPVAKKTAAQKKAEAAAKKLKAKQDKARKAAEKKAKAAAKKAAKQKAAAEKKAKTKAAKAAKKALDKAKKAEKKNADKLSTEIIQDADSEALELPNQEIAALPVLEEPQGIPSLEKAARPLTKNPVAKQLGIAGLAGGAGLGLFALFKGLFLH